MKIDKLKIPNNFGKIMLRSGGTFLCPLIKSDDFVKFCNKRNIQINSNRLLSLEHQKLFFPVFRVFEPDEDTQRLEIPLQNEKWFERGWALDTTNQPDNYDIPEERHKSEAYYSVFQISSLSFVLSMFTCDVHLESFLEAKDFNADDWQGKGKKLYEHAQKISSLVKMHSDRPAVDFLCQFISDRYYPHTRSNQRTRTVKNSGYSFDEWTERKQFKWDWHDYAEKWNPHEVEEIFALTPQNLRAFFKNRDTGLSVG